MATGRSGGSRGHGNCATTEALFPSASTHSPCSATTAYRSGFIELIENITEHLRAEEILQEREKRLSNIIANASETIYTLLARRHLHFRLAGLDRRSSATTCRGRGDGIDRVHPSRRRAPLCTDFCNECATPGNPAKAPRYRIRHKDGSWRWHRTAGSVIRDGQGNPTSYVGVAEDITARN